MFCENCGSKIGENESFCGQCGAHITNSNKQYDVYNYSVRQAKENGVYMPYRKVICYAMLLSLPLIIGAILIGLFMDDGPAMLIAGGLLCFIMITIIIIASSQIATYFKASLWTIVRDKEENVDYIMQQTLKAGGGWDTASRLAGAMAQAVEAKEKSKRAQVDALAINMVENYKAGLMERSALEKAFITPDQIVIKLSNTKVLKSNKKYIIVSYLNDKGKRKTIKIINAYPGFSI